MGFKLQADDLAVDQLVAVSRGPMEEKAIPYAYGVRRLTAENPDMNGMPLKIVGVSLPFIIGQFVHNQKPIVLDVRTIELARVNDEYAAAIKSFSGFGVASDDSSKQGDDPPPPDLIAEVVPV